MKVGETLAGRYELRQRVSSGRGTLYIAHDRRADRVVAVKVFDAAHVSSDDLRRYAVQLAAAATVSHPAVVVLKGQIAVSESPPFVVGEVLQGEDLGSLCARLKTVPWARASAIARTCADALVALSATGAAHRALRPGNVWIAENGQVQVLDFGIAELGAPPARPRPDGMFVEYRAPEQLEGAPGDARSDVFSLGVMLFEMVTGVHPYSGPNAAAVSIKLLIQPAPTPSQLAPHVQLPAALAALIGRAIARRPKDRFAEIADMARELAALLPNAEPADTAAPPAGPPEVPVHQSAPQIAKSRESTPAQARGTANVPETMSHGPLMTRPESRVDSVEERTLAVPRSGRPEQKAGDRTEILPRSDQPIVERTEVLPQAERRRSTPSDKRTQAPSKREQPRQTPVDEDARTQALRRFERPSEPEDDARTQTLRPLHRPSTSATVNEEHTQALTRFDGKAPRPGDETLILPDRRTAESTETPLRVGADNLPRQIQITHSSGDARDHEEQRGSYMSSSEITPLREPRRDLRRFLLVLNLVLAALLVVGWLWLRS